MFDLAWSEIALIAIIAILVIGPKDLPGAIRGVARGIQALRRKLGEFQSQADDLVKEANLDEVRNQIHEVRSAVSGFRNFDLKGEVERSVDPDGSVRRTFSGDPFDPPPAAAPAPAVPAAEPAAPAFIPPAAAAAVAPAPESYIAEPATAAPADRA